MRSTIALHAAAARRCAVSAAFRAIALPCALGRFPGTQVAAIGFTAHQVGGPVRFVRARRDFAGGGRRVVFSRCGLRTGWQWPSSGGLRCEMWHAICGCRDGGHCEPLRRVREVATR